MFLRRAFEGDEENKEAIGSWAILVDWAFVWPVGAVELLPTFAGLVLDEPGDVEDWERDVESFWLGLDEDAFLFVVCCAVEEEAVDVDALRGSLAHLLDALEGLDLRAVDDVVQGPLVCLVLADHFLSRPRQEARRIEEAGGQT